MTTHLINKWVLQIYQWTEQNLHSRVPGQIAFWWQKASPCNLHLVSKLNILEFFWLFPHYTFSRASLTFPLKFILHISLKDKTDVWWKKQYKSGNQVIRSCPSPAVNHLCAPTSHTPTENHQSRSTIRKQHVGRGRTIYLHITKEI